MTQTTAAAHSSVITLISDSGPMAKFVLLSLVFASVLCWSIIFAKWRALKRAQYENGKFLDIFWHGKTIDDILGCTEKFSGSPVAAVFKSGVKELKKLSGDDLASAGVEKIDNIHRALIRASNSEIAQLEKNVSWLATT